MIRDADGLILAAWLAGWFWLIPGAAWADEPLQPGVPPVQVEDELLEVGPIDNFQFESVDSAEENADELPTGEDDRLPSVTPASAAPSQLFPYYFSADIPPVDLTEVNLGLVLSAAPGIEVAAGWGATPEMMLSAKLTVQGSSHTTHLQGRYQLIAEPAFSPHPAVAAVAGWRYANHRTAGDNPQTIFRGNRLLIGAVLSKNFGSLARSINPDSGLAVYLDRLRLHVQALIEYQTGRENAAEEIVSRLEFGARAALEWVLAPDQLTAHVVYDTLPDWLNRQNYYLGVRYYSRPDFALDVLAGLIGEHNTVTLVLTWIF